MIVLVVEDLRLIGPDLRWPLRIANAHEGELLVLVPGAPRGKNGEPRAVTIDLEAPEPAAREIAADLTTLLAEHAPARSGTRVRWVEHERLAAEATAPLDSPSSDLILLVMDPADPPDDREQLRAALAVEAACSLAVVRPGTRPGPGEHCIAVAGGPHARAAVRLAERVTEREERAPTAVHVQADLGDPLGPDTPRVGRRALRRLLAQAVEERGERFRSRVEIDDRPWQGLARVVEDERFEVVWVGSSRLGALGEREASVGRRLAKAAPEPTLIVVREAVSLGNRARRWVDRLLQQRVPQLTRDERTSLVDRIQASGEWNLDFVLLMSSSTIIASLGLIDDSAAVIIGAMLVAPLMTPLLGHGLAISQGNPKLAHMTLKAAFLGFLTAFGLATAVGLASREFVAATPEMAARDWPQLLDLLVAFVAGLAAAYASGRPGLLAALPGVAIAAALLPPIATSGLALSIRDFDLAIGALLLFGVNMVAIVLASALALWAVGLRRLRHPTPLTRLLGVALILAAVGAAVGLTFAPPRLAPPPALVAEIERELDPGTRVRHIRLANEAEGVVVQVDLGGGTPPDAALAEELLRLTREHLGPETAVRLTHRFEMRVE